MAPPVTSAENARAIPRRSTPGSLQKRLSSIATIASRIAGRDLLLVVDDDVLGGANSPMGRPWSSYRYEFAACLYCARFSSWGRSEATAISIPKTVEMTASVAESEDDRQQPQLAQPRPGRAAVAA